MKDAPRPTQSVLPSLPFSPGKVIGGKYRVERRIGQGSTGIVVAAEHLELHEQVALKILNPELKSNKEALARFSREARAMFTLKSEHVGRVFDVGKLDTGEPYIVMELLMGQTLAELIKDARPTVSDAWLLIRQISEAVAEAHGAGIIHRDLKPENIFVEKKGEALSAKVIDFGVSRARFAQEENTITHVQTLLGTPRYMAPEQFQSSQAASPRSDVWSLGVIFYRMLAGSFPYTPKDVPDLVVQMKTTRPKALHDVKPDVTLVMSAIVMRCLSVRAEDRYEDGRELAQVIAAVPMPGAPSVTPASAAAVDAALDATPTVVGPPQREPQPSFSESVTTKRPAPGEDEQDPFDDVNTVPKPTHALVPAGEPTATSDPDEPPSVTTRVRTAVLRTPGIPHTPSAPPPPPTSLPSAPSSLGEDATTARGKPAQRAVAWSEIEVAVVVGAFITMLVIVVYMIAQRRVPPPTAPPPPTVTAPPTPTASAKPR